MRPCHQVVRHECSRSGPAASCRSGHQGLYGNTQRSHNTWPNQRPLFLFYTPIPIQNSENCRGDTTAATTPPCWSVNIPTRFDVRLRTDRRSTDPKPRQIFRLARFAPAKSFSPLCGDPPDPRQCPLPGGGRFPLPMKRDLHLVHQASVARVEA